MKNRYQKYADKPLSSYSLLTALKVFVYPETAGITWSFVGTIFKDFFFLQMFQVLHFTKYPVIYVDTELDNKIPFTPSYVKIYMGFIEYFIKPICMLIKRIGLKETAPYIKLYIAFLQRLYKNASSIYRFCMTTTHRPFYIRRFKFLSIHLFDPHLLCVPSLHVSIASGTYAWFRQFFKTGLFTEEDSAKYLEELHSQSIKIIESVLLVKQHSINCIPTALYMVTTTMNKSFFTSEDASEYINSFFNTVPEVQDSEKKELHEYFLYLYDRLYTERYYNTNWQDPVKRWLLEYANKTGQKIN